MGRRAPVELLAYRLAQRLPPAVTDRLPIFAKRVPLLRGPFRRASAAVREGPRAIVRGPAEGLLIDASRSRVSYVLGTAEPDLQEALRQLLAPGDVMYDLGANTGFFTLVGAACVTSAGAVVAVEPMPANAAALRANIELNDLHYVEVVEAAASGVSGRATLQRGRSDQDGRIVERSQAPADVETFDVDVVTVDGLVAEGRRPPTLLKVDVEGVELEVLRGAQETLLQHRPTVIVEIHDVGPDLSHPVARLLAEAGYATRWLESDVADDPEFWAPHLIATAMPQRPA